MTSCAKYERDFSPAAYFMTSVAQERLFAAALDNGRNSRYSSARGKWATQPALLRLAFVLLLVFLSEPSALPFQQLSILIDKSLWPVLKFGGKAPPGPPFPLRSRRSNVQPSHHVPFITFALP